MFEAWGVVNFGTWCIINQNKITHWIPNYIGQPIRRILHRFITFTSSQNRNWRQLTSYVNATNCNHYVVCWRFGNRCCLLRNDCQPGGGGRWRFEQGSSRCENRNNKLHKGCNFMNLYNFISNHFKVRVCSNRNGWQLFYKELRALEMKLNVHLAMTKTLNAAHYTSSKWNR